MVIVELFVDVVMVLEVVVTRILSWWLTIWPGKDCMRRFALSVNSVTTK